jgi:hypothetical protein
MVSRNTDCLTVRGEPVFLALPFDKFLLKEGVGVALAVKFFDDEMIGFGKSKLDVTPLAVCRPSACVFT